MYMQCSNTIFYHLSLLTFKLNRPFKNNLPTDLYTVWQINIKVNNKDILLLLFNIHVMYLNV